MKLEKNISDKFPTRRGVRQGNTLSPSMFNAGLEQMFKELDWEERGININGERLNHLRFADDIVVIGHSPKDLEVMINELQEKSNKLGLRINMKKKQRSCSTSTLLGITSK